MTISQELEQYLKLNENSLPSDLPQELARRLARAHTQIFADALGEADLASIKFANQYNLRTITSGQTDGMTVEQLLKQGFFGGLANPCCEIVIAHPQYGTTGSHLHTYTEKRMEAFLLKLAEGSSPIEFIKKYFEYSEMEYHERLRHIVPPEKRKETIIEATDNAVKKFLQVCKLRAMPPGCEVRYVGIAYAQGINLIALNQFAVGVGQKLVPKSHTESLLGKIGGFAYGGPHHRRFSKLTFIAGE